jgi:hypothetical protein
MESRDLSRYAPSDFAVGRVCAAPDPLAFEQAEEAFGDGIVMTGVEGLPPWPPGRPLAADPGLDARRNADREPSGVAVRAPNRFGAALSHACLLGRVRAAEHAAKREIRSAEAAGGGTSPERNTARNAWRRATDLGMSENRIGHAATSLSHAFSMRSGLEPLERATNHAV